VGKTQSSICTGKGNSCWDEEIKLNVTMYTDDDHSFKEKRLSIKIKEPRKGTSIAKGEVDISPLLSLDGSVKKIRLLLDPKKSGKYKDAKDHVGLTISIKPTWVDRKDDEPMSEMSEQGNSAHSSEEDEPDPDLNSSLSHSQPTRSRSGSGGNGRTRSGSGAPRPGPGHRRSRSQSGSNTSDIGSRGEVNRGGIPRQKSGSASRQGDAPGNPSDGGGGASGIIPPGGGESDQVDDLKMQVQVLKDRLQISENDAREAHQLLEHRTKILQENVTTGAEGIVDVERLQEENEELHMKVTALSAQLDVSCSGVKHGIPKPAGLDSREKEYIEMLEMELIQAKTTIAELKAGYDEVERNKRELETQKETWKGGRGHRRTNSRGGPAAFGN